MIKNKEFLLEKHPWNYFVPDNARTLLIGTFPPTKRNWSFDFFYPNKRNSLWKLLAAIASKEIIHVTDEYAVIERKQLLELLHLGITDMGKCVKRFDESSLDEKLELVEPMDIFQILSEYPTIKKIILTSSSGPSSAFGWFQKYLQEKNINFMVPKGKKPLSFIVPVNDAFIEVNILYSPSPRASNRISFPALVEMYERVIK